MRKICILVSTLEIGGAEKQAIILSNILSKYFDVYLCVIFSEKINDQLSLKIGDKVKVLKLNEKGIIGKFFEFNRLIKGLKIDVIFSYLFAANIFASLNGRMLNIKKIYTGVRNTNLPLHKHITEKFLNIFFATEIIFNSYKSRSQFYPKLDKGIVIGNCIENINPPRNNFSSSKSLKILSISRLTKQKDLKTALKSMKILKEKKLNFHYTIIGYGEELSKIKKYVMKLGLLDHVTIESDNLKKLKALETSDLYLCTSIYEGMSNSIIEAMSYSLPIIATNVGDNNVLVEHGKNGYICGIKESQNIANTIKKISDNKSLRKKMAFESNKRVRQLCSMEFFEASYLELLK